MHGNMGQRGPMPMYPPHAGPPMGMQNNRFGLPNLNGLPQSPPNMMPPQGRGMGYPFDAPGAGQPPPGFGPPHMSQQPNTTPPIGQPPVSAAPGGEVSRMPTHSRQQSASDKERFESAANQPIARPAPIQRPSSVKPQSQERRGSNTDIDDLSKHLGSSALLDDSDEPIPHNMNEARRTSTLPTGPRAPPPGGMQPFGTPHSSFGAPAGWNQQPPGFAAFGQPHPALGQANWGPPPPGMNMNMNTPMPSSSWAANNAAFASNSAFGTIGGVPPLGRPSAGHRPAAIRSALCQACRQLSATSQGDGEGFHDVEVLRRQMPPSLDPVPSLKEIEEVVETEGDGILQTRPLGDGGFKVKWIPDNLTKTPEHGVAGLGEIGSPMPSKSSPAVGFGAPGQGRSTQFQSLGAVGSGSASGSAA